MAFFPVMCLYKAFFKFTIGDIFLMFFFALSILKKPKIDKRTKICGILIVYTVITFFINAFLLKSIASSELFICGARLAKFVFYLAGAFITSRQFFNTRYFSKALIGCSIVFSILLFLQYILFYGFDKVFLPQIRSLLYIQEYAQVDYDRFFHFFFRPFSVFLEPAQFCQYMIVSVCMTLFSSEYGMKKKIAISSILGAAIIGSTSAQGLLYLALVIGFFLLVSIENKKILVGAGLVGVLCFVVVALKVEFIGDIVQRLLFNEEAREARMGTYSFIAELEGIQQFIGIGYGKVPVGEFFAGLPYVWYGTGIIGLILVFALFGFCYYYAPSKRSKILCIVFLAAFLATSLFYNYMLFWYFSLILCVKRDDAGENDKAYLFFRKSYLRRKRALIKSKKTRHYKEQRRAGKFIRKFEEQPGERKRILFILGMYHPYYSANGLCTKNIVDACIDNGYDVTCVVNSYHKEKSIDTIDGATIYRIEAKLFDKVDQWCQRAKNKLFAKIIKKIALVCNKIKLIVTAPVWPLCSPIYTSRFLEKAEELHKRNPFDIVISVYTPVSSLMAGYRLKKKYPEIQFVPYFLDSLSGGYGPKAFSKAKIINRGLKIERKTFKLADKIIIMKSAQNHQESYNREFSHKFCVLDIPMLKEVRIKEKELSDQKKLLFVGTLDSKVRNPQVFIDTLMELEDENIVVEFAGNILCKEKFSALQEKLGEKLVFTGYLNHDKLLEKIEEADVLVNIGNLVSTMVPSKIFEYMSYGKPIISTYDIENEPSRAYLSKYPLALLLNNKEGSAENGKKLKTFLKETEHKHVSFEEVEKLFYLNTPQALVNEVLGD